MKIAVVYLWWMPAGKDPFIRFINSYLFHDAGIEHDLIVLQTYEGQDIEAYFDIAEQITHEYVMFINTYTKILADGWLSLMYKELHHKNCGVVGAFGSWENCPNQNTTFPNEH